uniref:Cactin n=1 Tax=Rhabditophanes sp. KR3021 TaxID=114890 RepID=A0AC35TZV1_9BILA
MGSHSKETSHKSKRSDESRHRRERSGSRDRKKRSYEDGTPEHKRRSYKDRTPDHRRRKSKDGMESSLANEKAYKKEEVDKSDVFVWKKKWEDKNVKISDREMREKAFQNKRENLDQIDELQRKRQMRDYEREERETEARRLKNEECTYSHTEEETFVLKQAKLRLATRTRNGNACPIDKLARLILWEDPVFEDLDVTTFQEPYGIIKKLNVDELDDLIEDIKVLKKIDGEDHPVYWTDCDRLAKYHFKQLTDPDTMNEQIKGQVVQSFAGNSLPELLVKESQLETKVNDPNTGNTGFLYWALDELRFTIGKQRISETFTEVMQKQVKLIEALHAKEVNSVNSAETDINQIFSNISAGEVYQLNEKLPFEINELMGRDRLKVARLWKALNRKQTLFSTVKLYEIRGFEPKFFKKDQLLADGVVKDAGSFYENLKKLHKESLSKRVEEEEVSVRRPHKSDMNDRNEVFGDEVDLGTSAVSWRNTGCKAKKPKYTNIVRTGFDWNKYNRTHYSYEDLPPKIVKGYKFVIMYDELLDPTQTPSYTVKKDPSDEEFAIITFKAGPPYMDIAFKIINREWQILQKRGYAAQFAKGVFELEFSFKHYRYRR